MITDLKILEEFFAEAKEHLDKIEADFLALENKDDPALIEGIFRKIHSIKGAAGFLGLGKVSDLTHTMETMLSMLRSGKILSNTESIGLLLAGLDLLKSLITDPGSESRVDIAPVCEKIEDFLAGNLHPVTRTELATRIRLFTEGEREHRFEVKVFDRNKIPSHMSLYVLEYNLILLGEKSPVELIRKLLSWGNLLDGKVDTPVEDLDTDLSKVPLIYEALFATELSPSTLFEKTDMTGARALPVLREETVLPPSVEEMDHPEKEVPQTEKRTSIRVPEKRLDLIVDLVGELVTVQSNLTREARLMKKNPRIQSIAKEIERLTGSLRDNTLGIRMLPLDSLFTRFHRLIRDLSQKQRKSVKMLTEGGKTELDKSVLEQLNDPMIHIIRNSIDHGFESEKNRRAAGKPEQGTLKISARHSGSNVLIQISDDGAGIDPESVRKKAVERGLMDPGARPGEKELLSLIFQAGFSTAQTISQISGRGVGMDVVKKQVEKLRGSVNVESQKGTGTTITLKIPLTLAIIDGLLVRIGTDHFVFPLSIVEKCIELSEKDRIDTKRRNMMNYKGETIPYTCLRRQLQIDGTPEKRERIVVAESSSGLIGFGVDQVIGHHQTVIKKLGKIYQNIEGVGGATILGDGQVALILDINRLAEMMK